MRILSGIMGLICVIAAVVAVITKNMLMAIFFSVWAVFYNQYFLEE